MFCGGAGKMIDVSDLVLFLAAVRRSFWLKIV